MNMSINAGNAAYLSGAALAGQNSAAPSNNAQDSLAGNAAGQAQLQGLSDVHLRELAFRLVDLRGGLATMNGDLGATAISLPNVASKTDMGALSTADLLQLFRAERAKTTAMLSAATMEAITAQQATMEIKRADNTAKINESIEKQKEAEELKKKMETLKWVMYALGGLAIAIMGVADLFTGGATLAVAAGIAALMMAATVCATEIKTDENGKIDNENGTSAMDKAMKWLGTAFADLMTSMRDMKENDPAMFGFLNGLAAVATCGLSLIFTIPASIDEETLPDDKAGEITAVSFMAALQIALATLAILATLGAAAPAVASTATSVAASTATSAATTAATTAASTAVTSANTLANVTSAAARAAATLQLLSAMTGMAQGAGNIVAADMQYDADMANAMVTQLKAMIKMLEQLLQGDMEFIQLLVDLQAKLDAWVANIVATEHASAEQTDLHGGSMA